MRIEITWTDAGTSIEVNGIPAVSSACSWAETRTSGTEAPAEIRSVRATALRKIHELTEMADSANEICNWEEVKRLMKTIRELCSNEN